MAVLSNFGVPTQSGTSTTLMPKLQYRFRVNFTNLGGPTGATGGVGATKNVVSVTRPSMSHEEITVDAYNSKIYLAGKHTWEAITLVLRDDVDSEVIKLLGQQLNVQVDHAAQSGATSGKDYKFGMTIETLDGNNGDNGTASVMDQWKLSGCYIQNIQYGDLNYSASDVVQVTVTIRYDNAAHNIDDRDALSILSTAHDAGVATS